MLDHEVIAPVETLKGEYVKRITRLTPDSMVCTKKVYKVAGYDRNERKWQLDDVEDISRCVYVKKGTMLVAGFTY